MDALLSRTIFRLVSEARHRAILLKGRKLTLSSPISTSPSEPFTIVPFVVVRIRLDLLASPTSVFVPTSNPV